MGTSLMFRVSHGVPKNVRGNLLQTARGNRKILHLSGKIVKDSWAGRCKGMTALNPDTHLVSIGCVRPWATSTMGGKRGPMDLRIRGEIAKRCFELAVCQRTRRQSTHTHETTFQRNHEA